MRFSISKHFRFLFKRRNISFQNDIPLKTTKWRVLSWEKLKNCATHGESKSNCWSLAWTSQEASEVHKLLSQIAKLKLAMSANLKHSKSTWRQLIVLWKTDKIKTSKALGTMHARPYLISERERSINDSCRFDVGRFRTEPSNYKRCLHPISWHICTSQWPQ